MNDSVSITSAIHRGVLYYYVQKNGWRVVVSEHGTVNVDLSKFPMDIQTIARAMAEWCRTDKGSYQGKNAIKMKIFLTGQR